MKKLILFLLMLLAPLARAETLTLTSTNFISLNESISDESASAFINKLFTFKGDTVYIYINSPGGSIVAGTKIINAMKSSGKETVCITDYAASMAFSILQACDKRYILDGAIVMQHEASYQAKGSSSEIRSQVEFAEKLILALNKHDAKRLGLTLDKFKSMIHDDWWMYGDGAIEANAADKKVNLKCTAELTNKRQVQTIQSIFGAVTLEWSGCPLVYYPTDVKFGKEKDVDQRTFMAWYNSLQMTRDWKTTKEVR